MAPLTTSAILLRSHDYGDTSRILRFYTLEHGLLSVMARGVRGKSGKGQTTLSSYATGTLTAYVKPQRDLHTMKDFSCEKIRDGLSRHVLRFAGAAATAELVLAHADEERQPALFEALESALDVLAESPVNELPAATLSAIWTVTEAFGFAPQLDSCVHCGEELGVAEIGRFDFGAGGVRCEECGHGGAGPRIGPVARGQIAAFVRGEPIADLGHPRRHLGIVTDFVAFHVASRPLKSLHFLGSVLPADQEVSA